MNPVAIAALIFTGLTVVFFLCLLSFVYGVSVGEQQAEDEE